MSYTDVKQWRKSTKQLLIDAMGCKCNRCGYDKCHSALDFHHIDGSNKDGTISQMLSHPTKTKNIVEEAMKCVLLCKICHCEIHEGLWCLDEIVVCKLDTSVLPWQILKESRTCPVCEIQFIPNYKDKAYCSVSCSAQAREIKSDRPSKDELQILVWQFPITEIADVYQVSDQSVIKWCNKFGCKRPPRGYWLRA